MKKYLWVVFLSASLLGGAASTVAQSTEGRIAFGFTAGGNKLYGDFRDNQFFFSGDLFLRWNIFDFLSLHAGYGGGQMRMRLNEDNINKYPNYFGPIGGGVDCPTCKYPEPTDPAKFTDINREYRSKIRHQGPFALLSFNLFPLQEFVPYITAGVELLNFEPRNVDQDKALPYLSAVGYDRNTLGLLAGLGFELYVSDNLTLNFRGLYHHANTAFLDDFSEDAYKAFENKSTPSKTEGSTDVFLTFGIGMSYYIFGDQDADKDGLRDGAERDIYKTDPSNPDTDGDGIIDGEEVKKYNTDPTKSDTDGDGLNDHEELFTHKTDPKIADTDGDGINDGQEVKAYKTDPSKPDTDGDGLTDGQEINEHKTDPLKQDTDDDGLLDGDEIRKYSTSPIKSDSDGDGLSDGDEVMMHSTDPSKADTDGDGLSDGEEIKQYQTDARNPDTDKDGLIDGDEIKHLADPKNPDTDGDQLTDGEEVNQYKTSPAKADTDGDALADGDEIRQYNTDPLKADTDGDGLSDGEEIRQYQTDALRADTDADGLADGEEIRSFKTDPLKADSDADELADGDEVKVYKSNPILPDTDGDGLSDGNEVHRVKTSPLNPDSDGDGISDGKDKCPLIPGDAPDGCPPKPKPNTVTNFPGVIFIVNQDAFDMTEPGTLDNLNKIRALVEQCPELKVEIEGHASSEGDPKRNQELSDMRAARVKQWLIDQGVSADKIVRTIGYGSSKLLVPEPKPSKKVTPAIIEKARKQNRRIAVRVVETCQ